MKYWGAKRRNEKTQSCKACQLTDTNPVLYLLQKELYSSENLLPWFQHWEDWRNGGLPGAWRHSTERPIASVAFGVCFCFRIFSSTQTSAARSGCGWEPPSSLCLSCSSFLVVASNCAGSGRRTRRDASWRRGWHQTPSRHFPPSTTVPLSATSSTTHRPTWRHDICLAPNLHFKHYFPHKNNSLLLTGMKKICL